MTVSVEFVERESDRVLATYPTYGEHLPRIGESVELLATTEEAAEDVRGLVKDVRHYPDEKLVTVELSTHTEQGESHE